MSEKMFVVIYRIGQCRLCGEDPEEEDVHTVIEYEFPDGTYDSLLNEHKLPILVTTLEALLGDVFKAGQQVETQ